MTLFRRVHHRIRTNGAILILSVTVVIHTMILLTSIYPDLVQRIWQARTGSAEWRSAAVHFGENYANYIEFVKTHTPIDSLVIIPKEEQVWNFGNVGLMQYYLYPRRIADCPIELLDDCILKLRGKDVYILAPTLSFPPRAIADQVKHYLPFNQDSGLYVPLP
jgi:hypothetical protein